MDEEQREVERRAASGDMAARVAFRRGLERQGDDGTFDGLAVGDVVEVVSCLPGPERRWRGWVRGVSPEGTPLVFSPDPYGGSERMLADVSGCPRCHVRLVAPGPEPKRPEGPR
jgi:hypothetical protein